MNVGISFPIDKKHKTEKKTEIPTSKAIENRSVREITKWQKKKIETLRHQNSIKLFLNLLNKTVFNRFIDYLQHTNIFKCTDLTLIFYFQGNFDICLQNDLIAYQRKLTKEIVEILKDTIKPKTSDQRTTSEITAECPRSME